MKKKQNWTQPSAHRTTTSSNRRRKAVLLGTVLCIGSGIAQAQQTGDANGAATPQIEETVVVKAKALSAAQKAKDKLDDVPGGTSLVNSDDVEKGRVFTNEDVLAYQPGVFAQAAGGADGIKISVRGSAINRGTNFFRSGILFLFDGLPVTGPGGTPYELFEPLGLSYTEILRGANAFDYGSLALGGAINYVTKTGYDAPKLEFRYEGGSFGYRKSQLSGGAVVGPLDYYVSYTESHRDGYQKQSAGTSRGLVANIGYKVNDDITTRFYFRYRETSNQQPGSLTVQQIEDDPKQANPTNVAQHATRNQPGSTWIGNKTTFRLDGTSKLDVGFVYHDYPIDQELNANSGKWNFTDASASVDYSRSDVLFGKASNSRIGFLITKHLTGDQDTDVRIPGGATAGLPVGTRIRHAEYGGQDAVLHASNDLELAPSVWLTSGLSAINTRRFTEVTFPETDTPYKRTTWDWAPRLGLRFNATPDIQVYGNVSRTVEPPNSWAFLTTPPAFSSGPAKGLARQGLDLKDQTATTFELGTRGKVGNNDWTLSVYRSLVRNELLSVELVPGSGVSTESNASPTVHQGIEASLASLLWQKDGHKVTLRQAYTFSDFNFRDDATFGGNALPGIPRNFYQAQIEYAHPKGFYASFNTQAASSYAIDYANSFYTKGYTIFGATFGYDSPEGWKLFVDFSNLGDKHYVSSVSPTFNLKGSDATNPRSSPGDGFGVFAGFSYAFK
ncbi:MAG TPA: TonB-dependent receptor [Oxalicibacterium sp.]|nr:TonB-dependent receptor [Oxalicibacterium sp.]